VAPAGGFATSCTQGPAPGCDVKQVAAVPRPTTIRLPGCLQHSRLLGLAGWFGCFTAAMCHPTDRPAACLTALGSVRTHPAQGLPD
jgi:hypothetical protein